MSALGRALDDLRWRLPLWWWLPVRRRGGRRFALRWAYHQDITEALVRAGVDVQPYRIDLEAFWRFVDHSGYRQMQYYQGGAMATAYEKWLEHWVSIDLMAPRRGEVLIDVASCASPFPEVIAARCGVQSYRQDLVYPPGIEGDRIGGDAAAMPVADGFTDLLTLHCSFEHFEGDADSRFVREASRLLRPGGRLCIVPLYTCRDYCIQSDPATWAEQPVRFEPDATVCLARGWSERHGRLYDHRHFLDRVVDHLGDLALTVYAVENAHRVAPDCYLSFAAVLRKPAAELGG